MPRTSICRDGSAICGRASGSPTFHQVLCLVEEGFFIAESDTCLDRQLQDWNQRKSRAIETMHAEPTKMRAQKPMNRRLLSARAVTANRESGFFRSAAEIAEQ